MAVVVARMIARLEAETSGFDSRIAGATQKLAKWENASATGARSTVILHRAMEQLSFQAAGIPGPVGRAASAIGALGVGGGPVFLAIAAIGALSLIQRAYEADTIAATKAQEDFLQALAKTAEGARIVASNRLATARESVDALQAKKLLVGETWTGREEARLVQAQQEVAKLANLLAGAETTAAVAAVQRRKEIERQNEELKKQHFLMLQIRLENDILAGRLTTSGIPSKLPGGAKFEPGFPKPFMDDKFPAREFFNDPLAFLEKSGGKLARAKSDSLQIAQMAAASVMMVMSQAGGGATLSGGGMFLSGLSGMSGISKATSGALGWAGFALSTIGGLFSLFEHRESERERQEERRHKELIGAIHDSPTRVTVISANDPAADLYALRRQERLGGDPRLGGL